MKRIQPNAIALLSVGLLMVSLTPILSRYFTWPDSLKGFLTGLGLMLELLGLLRIQRRKKCRSCAD
jgi:hypothetical protein